MEQAWSTAEAGSVPDSLGHGFRDVQPLHPLDFDIYPGQAHQVRHFPVRQGAATLNVIAVFPEDRGQLPLACAVMICPCCPPVCLIAGFIIAQFSDLPRKEMVDVVVAAPVSGLEVLFNEDGIAVWSYVGTYAASTHTIQPGHILDDTGNL